MIINLVSLTGILLFLFCLKNVVRSYFYGFYEMTSKAYNIPADTLCKMSILSHFSYKDPEHVEHFENAVDEFNMIHTLKEFIYKDNYISFIDTAKTNKDGILAECYLWVAKKTLFIIFRGTESIEDWQINMDLRIKNLPIDKNIRVHQGFYRQFMSIEKDVTRKMKEKRATHPFDNIVFAGHSLGGAIATIATFYYYHLFY